MEGQAQGEGMTRKTWTTKTTKKKGRKKENSQGMRRDEHSVEKEAKENMLVSSRRKGGEKCWV